MRKVNFTTEYLRKGHVQARLITMQSRQNNTLLDGLKSAGNILEAVEHDCKVDESIGVECFSVIHRACLVSVCHICNVQVDLLSRWRS